MYNIFQVKIIFTNEFSFHHGVAAPTVQAAPLLTKAQCTKVKRIIFKTGSISTNKASAYTEDCGFKER